jgi:metal-sulfur cluster biosynthetic enzyme
VTEVGSSTLARVREALGEVFDPEIDEPITDLGFVESCTVDEDGTARVRLRLPTFYCAPNFSFLMVADAHDAVSAVPGVRAVDVALIDHHAADEINAGVTAGAGFVGTFAEEATSELDDLRRQFLAKAAVAGQDRVARPLVDAGASPQDLAATHLGDLSETPDLARLRRRRHDVGLPDGDDAPLLLHADGSPVTAAQVPLHLRRARLTRFGIEANGEFCKGLLAARYPTGSARSPTPVGDDLAEVTQR